MADVTGTLRREYNGKTYAMRLTPLGIAALQDRYGNDFIADLEREKKKMPNMRLFVDIVTEALIKGEGLPREEAATLADDLMGAELTLAMTILNTAFPTPEPAEGGSEADSEGGEGNAEAPEG